MHQADLVEAPGNGRADNAGGMPPIPYQMTVLPNGLTLIVHEDRRNPLVCTQLRFNVGSKDEPAGRTGFAHLFEHLMFKESAHRRGNWHRMLQAMGGMGVNGTTDTDWTNYFQTVPKGALDRLLWMESDRMGHLLDGIDAATLADEVAVVKNEKREREGAPYGGVFEAISTALYPREHPYGHTVLGSFEDLDNATMETVADWYGRWYGASNAVLVLSGDIGFEEAKEKVEYWFGAVPAGTPVRRVTRWLPDVQETRHLTLFDRVPFRRVYSVWSTPESIDPDSPLLGMVAQIMAGGAHSRLVQRLVDRDRLCLDTGAGHDGRYLCGQFSIMATLVPGVEPAQVATAIEEELQRLIAEGPTGEELERIRQSYRKGFLRALDDLGSITETLASNMIIYGHPHGHERFAAIVDAATPGQICEVAARWLSRKAIELDVRPFEATGAATDPADRTRPPALCETVSPPFPPVQESCLGNGLKVRFVRRPGTYSTSFALHLDNGSNVDPVGGEGLSVNAFGLMAAGTERYLKTDLAAIFAEKGIKYSSNVSKDFSTIGMVALNEDVGHAMALMAEIVTRPLFPQEEVQLMLDRQIARAHGQGAAPASAAGMAIGPLIFGAGHDYSRLASGTAESLSSITRDMIIQRHRQGFAPNRATLIIVGDLSFDQALDMAEKAFGGWSASGEAMVARESLWSPSPGRYFIERPGGPQSALQIAFSSPRIVLGNAASMVFNSLFGGSFGSRLNANLRERRGWTYGVNSRVVVSPQIGAFHISTGVQADRTLDALTEIENEMVALTGSRKVTAEEIEEARRGLLAALPGRWVGNASVANAVIEGIVFDLPPDYQDGLENRLRAVSADDIAATVEMFCDPAAFSWVVSGDAAHVGGAGFIPIDARANRL